MKIIRSTREGWLRRGGGAVEVSTPAMTLDNSTLSKNHIVLGAMYDGCPKMGHGNHVGVLLTRNEAKRVGKFVGMVDRLEDSDRKILESIENIANPPVMIEVPEFQEMDIKPGGVWGKVSERKVTGSDKYYPWASVALALVSFVIGFLAGSI